MIPRPFDVADILVIINDHITTGSDYKALISITKFANLCLKNIPHNHMNVFSTLIKRNDLNWNRGKIAPYVNEATITDYLNYVYPRANWRQIAKNPRLSREFIARWIKLNNVHQHDFYAHPNAPLEILRHVIDYNEYYETSLPIPPIKFMFIKKYIRANPIANMYDWDGQVDCILRDCQIFRRWNIIIPTQYTRQYIRENINEMDIYIQSHPNFYIEYHQLQPTWFLLSTNPNLTPTYITQHVTKWKWRKLSQNRALTIDLMEQYIDHVDFSSVWKNPNMTLEFMERYIARFRGILYVG